MPTSYPDALDAFSNPTSSDNLDSVSVPHATQHTNANDAIEAIEAELGTNPAGESATVKARLDTADSTVSAHTSSTTSVHGITDTADLVVTSDSRLTDARTPTAHAATHESGGSDELTLAQSQVTDLMGGSVLRQLPMQVDPAEQLLKQAVWWIDAAHSSASGQSVSNLGWGGSALDARVGSTGSADSNDPKLLDWTGENYCFLPGVSGNYLSVPDEAALDITGDIDIRVKVALDDWTPASQVSLLTRAVSLASITYGLRVRANTGYLDFIWTSSGGGKQLFSDAAPGFSDGAVGWVRVTLDVDDGAGNHVLKFWKSDDGEAWTQVGSTITTAGTTDIAPSAAALHVGAYSNGTGALAASVYRAIIKDGIDGTPVLDVDCSQITSGSNTSFTALTGQTVTINRSTSGRKAVAVTHPCWLFGTDDYMEVPDNDLLDFGASDSFTVLTVVRQWATPGSYARYINKGAAGNGPHYILSSYSTSLASFASVADGTTAAQRLGLTAIPAGQTSVLGMHVDRTAQTLATSINGTLSATASTSSVGSLANTLPLRVGNQAASQNADMEFIAAAIWRRALTSGEIATLNSYFQGRA